MSSATPTQENQGTLGLFDAVSIILGIIIGAGVYETPPEIFQLIGDPWHTLGIWAACGLLALIGALCYAELATTYPRSGGDYVYISRAYGPLAGYLFAWAQLAVIQTGAIGLMAYIFADYGSRLYQLVSGEAPAQYMPVAFAGGAIVVMTALNILGVVLGKLAQNLLTFAKIVGLGAILVAGFAYPDKDQIVTEGKVVEAMGDNLVVDVGTERKTFTVTEKTRLHIGNKTLKVVQEKGDDGKVVDKEVKLTVADYAAKDEEAKTTEKVVRVVARSATPTEPFLVNTTSPPALTATSTNWGLITFALVLVFLTYGGWNDAAFVAAEVRNRSRNIPLALVIGTAGVTVIYLAVNYAYIHGLGFERARVSKEVAADVLSLLPWEYGEKAMCVLVMISALGAVNGLIFTSSRIYATLGKDYSLFAALGWNESSGSPVASLLIQMIISLAMVLGVGTETGQNFLNHMIELSLGTGAGVNWAGQRGFYSLLRCTAPVFWIFFLMTGLGLFTLRRNDPNLPRPFRVPLYPILPLIFCATCGYMVYSGVGYAGRLGLIGGLLVVAGLPFYVFSKRSPGAQGQLPSH